MMTTTGALYIARERARQIEEEGYSTEHDEGHARELVQAAEAYAYHAEIQLFTGQSTLNEYFHSRPGIWPWSAEDWKPSDDPKKNLIKAGALIAAAIDSLEAEE